MKALMDYTPLFGKVVNGWLVKGYEKDPEGITPGRQLRCVCKCGREVYMPPRRLLDGLATHCLECETKERRTLVVGEKYGKWTILSFNPKEIRKRRYELKCECGYVCRQSGTNLRSGSSAGCMRCSKEWPEYEGTIWHKVRASADSRGIELTVNWPELKDLLEKQDYSCALSSLPLFFAKCAKEYPQHTASMDRIDSKLGYHINNVQWVHKRVNFMKQSLSDDEFIWFCRCVAAKHTKMASCQLEYANAA